ncbi:hypothetical protein KQ939_05260 [Planococcus sp. CP5-4]|uniref:hypothetical protein n=1 Tax=unclassified Planococcus (in: firmicutes) TaxID=2662419 RepID=UPI001C244591|nr:MULTISPECIES: hypothetical protein [unclassified Planococcus (in: firmicutes)]MBU9673669.1 hypothetical protein [Planococcus sp. CP5-4_YE]MBV0907959.1 hypothetical protein [Planococcus sp. CP5-4_UN]MBW6063126.1 hypothetical protein [Planococcus sp. CP5-4]
MKHWLGFGGVALMLTVAGCGTQETVTEESEQDMMQEEATENEAAKAEKEETPAKGTSGDSHDSSQAAVDPYDYFLEDGSIARFEGFGNEFAEFTLKTDYMEANHVVTYEDNGGTVVLKVFRLHDDRIELVKQEGEFYDDFTASFEELEALEVISTYLEFPIEEGQEIGDATVVETGASLETPYQNFDDVFVLESMTEDGSINRNYFVEGYGEVKREFRANADDLEELAITSTLASIEFAETKK